MSRRPQFAPIPEEEALERARQDTPAAAEMVAQLSRRPALQPTTGPSPAVEPAQPDGSEEHDADKPNVRMWPTGDILVHKYNARRLPLSSTQLDKLTKSMQVRQRTPIPAYIDENGKPVAIDGRRRIAAATNGGIPELKLEIIPKPATDREAYQLSRAYNVEREQQNPLDDALSWKLLLEKGVYASQKEISDDTGIDEGDVSRILKLTELPQRILEILNGQEELMNLRMLTALRMYYDVAGEEETKALIISAESGELSSRDVDRLRKAHEKAPVPRARSTGTLNFAFVQGAAKVKQFDSARKVVIEIENVAPGVSLSDITAALKATMRTSLGGEVEGS